MEQTPNANIEGWVLAVWLVLTLFSAVGLGSLIKLAFDRLITRADRHAKEAEDRDGKAIDADLEAVKMFKDRLEHVEARQQKLQEAHNSLMVDKTKLEARNEHLESENARLNTEVNSLRIKVHELSTAIMHRDAEVSELRGRIDMLSQALDGGKTESRATQ